MSWLSNTFKKLVNPIEDLAGTAINSFVGGSIGSHFDKSVNASTSKEALENSKKLFEYQNSNKYQYMVDDLNKAGLNPMLAVSGMQGSAGGFVQGSSRTSDENGFNNAMAIRQQLRIQEKQAETERLKMEAERDEKRVNMAYLKALTDRTNLLAPAENGLMIAQTEFHRSNILNTAAEIDKIYSDIRNNNRITDSQINKLIEDAKHLRVITGNESIKYDLLVRARDSKSEAIKRELLDMWQWQTLHNIGYMFDLVTGNSGVGLTSAGKFGFKMK